MNNLTDLADFILREVYFIRGYIKEVDDAAVNIIKISSEAPARVEALNIVKANREILAQSNIIIEHANSIYRIGEEENKRGEN